MLTRPWWEVLDVSPHESIQFIEATFIVRVMADSNPVAVMQLRQALIDARKAKE